MLGLGGERRVTQSTVPQVTGHEQKQVPATVAPSAEERFGKEQVKVKAKPKDLPESISARISGEFRGWNGQYGISPGQRTSMATACGVASIEAPDVLILRC